MTEASKDVEKLLYNLRGMEPLKELFWRELNYDRADQPIPTGSWTDSSRAAIAENPVLFATAGEDNSFHIIYCRLHSEGRLRITDERILINRLIRDHPYSLFIFSDALQERWHFVNVRYEPTVDKRRILRRITIGPEERLRTASERILLLDAASIDPSLFGVTALQIQQRHDEAFDVEAVTKQFFDDYCSVFRSLETELSKQIHDKKWAHDYALGFLNRLMFIYFIQRKRWLGGDTEFIRSYWNAYQDAGRPRDTFFEQWLKLLFFHAFNNDKGVLNTPRTQYIPGDVRKVLSTAPYLNGGLFSENDLDRPGQPFNISDAQLKRILDFLDRYNFTIAEDSPLDQEVAVDPEMIGKVYESLVNVSEEAEERGDAGIFYTPRTEIDLMCRLALVDNLSNRIGADHRKLLYELVFALEPNEKQASDAAVEQAGLWNLVRETLRDTKIVDPACGSGSFLVGMLHILDDLETRAQRFLGESEESAYERRKRIIGNNLYGVDVMEWACHIAELRLWLALIIDAEFEQSELAVRSEPLLPNFTFNIRCGDSLVQEVAGIDLAHLAESGLSASMKRRIAKLGAEKAKFYYCDRDCEFHSVQDALQAERSLFNEILQDRIANAQKQLAGIGSQSRQASFGDGGFDKPDQGSQADNEKVEMLRAEKEAEIADLRRAQQELSSVSRIPFVWRIAFAEVFHGDKNGFDIVIGNPPYVRQENISDPRLPREKVTVENKRDYKDKLALTTYRDHPDFFGYKPASHKAANKIDAKSDLYIYFYFRGLHLLNPTGSFVFITSNSWLDVGYGADLQEFLLRQCHVKLIIDNQVKRSFASADVNTIICLLSAPAKQRNAGSAHDARFVMFKVPFEQVLSAVVFQEIEEAQQRRSTPEYRVHVIPQSELLERGLDQPVGDEEDSETTSKKGSGPFIKVGKYVGDKWGGKYLRAPDIYWTILEKGKDKLVRLGDIAEVRRGFTTGCNEFFYLDEEKIKQWGIEEEFLRPVLVSPRESRTIIIDPATLRYKVFMCHKSRTRLHGSQALEYVKWGEAQGFHKRATCRSRRPWWDLGESHNGDIAWAMMHAQLHNVYSNPHSVELDHNFFEILPSDASHQGPVASCSICSLSILAKEVLGRAYGGGSGPIKNEGIDIKRFPILDPGVLTTDLTVLMCHRFRALTTREMLPVYEEVRQPDRKALDEVVFDVLGLTQGERDAVYEAIIDLVTKRLSKAESV